MASQLNLKKNRPAGQCAAMRCVEKATIVTDLGDAPDLRGVALCDRHAGMVCNATSLASTGRQVVAQDPADFITAEMEAAKARFAQGPEDFGGEDAPHAPAAAALVVKPQDERAELEAQAQELTDTLAEIELYQMTGQGDVDFAKVCIEEMAAQVRHYDAKRKRLTIPLNKALDEANELYQPVIKAGKAIQSAWTHKIESFLLEQRRAAQVATAAAAVAAHTGDMLAVQSAMAVAATASDVDLKGLATVERWTFEVTDPAAVPAAYLMVDAAKVQAVVDQYKYATQIPGIQVRKVETLRRTGK